MKRIDEDRLVRLAFGDLSLEESAALEKRALVDPESARTLAEYRNLRDELRSLAEVPPHQMSNERLRDAILGQGLRPKAPESIWSWLWMPASVACLVAISFMYVQRHRPSEPQLISMNSPRAGVTDAVPSLQWKPSIGHVASGKSLAKPVSKGAPPDLRLASNDQPVQTRHHHHLHRSPWANANLVTMKQDEAPDTATPASSTDTQNPTASTATLKPVDNDPSPPVVLIDSETDQNTGASKATEVGSGNNVVVGG